jgi:hypothetical protein
MAKKDTSDGSGQPAKPRARKSRKGNAAPVTAVEMSAESVSYSPSDEDIAREAYALWERRGRPMGSPDEDWYRARQELATHAKSNGAHA